MSNRDHSNRDDVRLRRRLVAIIQEQSDGEGLINIEDVKAAGRRSGIDSSTTEAMIRTLQQRGSIEQVSNTLVRLTYQ